MTYDFARLMKQDGAGEVTEVKCSRVRAGHHQEHVTRRERNHGAGKKKIGLIGGGQIGGNLALLAVQKQPGRRGALRHPRGRGHGEGQGAGHQPAVRGGWLRLPRHRDHRLEGRRRQRRRHHHRRRAAEAGHEPRGPARGQPEDHEGRGGEREGALPERVRDQHRQPAGRDGLRALQDHRLQEEPGGRAWPACWTRRASSASSPRR